MLQDLIFIGKQLVFVVVMACDDFYYVNNYWTNFSKQLTDF